MSGSGVTFARTPSVPIPTTAATPSPVSLVFPHQQPSQPNGSPPRVLTARPIPQARVPIQVSILPSPTHSGGSGGFGFGSSAASNQNSVSASSNQFLQQQQQQNRLNLTPPTPATPATPASPGTPSNNAFLAAANQTIAAAAVSTQPPPNANLAASTATTSAAAPTTPRSSTVPPALPQRALSTVPSATPSSSSWLASAPSRRLRIFHSLSFPSCHLFTNSSRPLAVSDFDLDAVVLAAGGGQDGLEIALGLVKEMDEENVKLETIDQLNVMIAQRHQTRHTIAMLKSALPYLNSTSGLGSPPSPTITPVSSSATPSAPPSNAAAALPYLPFLRVLPSPPSVADIASLVDRMLLEGMHGVDPALPLNDVMKALVKTLPQQQLQANSSSTSTSSSSIVPTFNPPTIATVIREIDRLASTMRKRVLHRHLLSSASGTLLLSPLPATFSSSQLASILRSTRENLFWTFRHLHHAQTDVSEEDAAASEATNADGSPAAPAAKYPKDLPGLIRRLEQMHLACTGLSPLPAPTLSPSTSSSSASNPAAVAAVAAAFTALHVSSSPLSPSDDSPKPTLQHASSVPAADDTPPRSRQSSTSLSTLTSPRPTHSQNPSFGTPTTFAQAFFPSVMGAGGAQPAVSSVPFILPNDPVSASGGIVAAGNGAAPSQSSPSMTPQQSSPLINADGMPKSISYESMNAMGIAQPPLPEASLNDVVLQQQQHQQQPSHRHPNHPPHLQPFVHPSTATPSASPIFHMDDSASAGLPRHRAGSVAELSTRRISFVQNPNSPNGHRSSFIHSVSPKHSPTVPEGSPMPPTPLPLPSPSLQAQLPPQHSPGSRTTPSPPPIIKLRSASPTRQQHSRLSLDAQARALSQAQQYPPTTPNAARPASPSAAAAIAQVQSEAADQIVQARQAQAQAQAQALALSQAHAYALQQVQAKAQAQVAAATANQQQLNQQHPIHHNSPQHQTYPPHQSHQHQHQQHQQYPMASTSTTQSSTPASMISPLHSRRQTPTSNIGIVSNNASPQPAVDPAIAHQLRLDRAVILSSLSYPKCTLFSALPAPLQLTDYHLDELLRIAGHVDAVCSLLRTMEKEGIKCHSVDEFFATFSATLANERREELVQYLLYPRCTLFTQCTRPIEIEDEDLDQLLNVAGTLPLAIRAISEFETAKRKFYSFAEMMLALESDDGIRKRRELKRQSMDLEQMKKMNANVVGAANLKMQGVAAIGVNNGTSPSQYASMPVSPTYLPPPSAQPSQPQSTMFPLLQRALQGVDASSNAAVQIGATSYQHQPLQTYGDSRMNSQASSAYSSQQTSPRR